MLRRWLGPVSAIAMLAGGVYGLGVSHIRPLRVVEVVGATPLTSADLGKALKRLLPRYLVSVDPSTLQAAITKALPYASVEVERDWPDTLHVYVRERKPYAMVIGDDGRIALVNGDGYLASLRHDQGIALWDRPAIRGCPVPDDPQSAAHCVRLGVSFLSWLDMVDPGWLPSLSEIDVDGNAIRLVLVDGTRIDFGTAPFSEKLRALRYGWSVARAHQVQVNDIVLVDPRQVILAGGETYPATSKLFRSASQSTIGRNFSGAAAGPVTRSG